MRCRKCRQGDLWTIRTSKDNRAEFVTVCEVCDQGCDKVSSPILVAEANKRVVTLVPK